MQVKMILSFPKLKSHLVWMKMCRIQFRCKSAFTWSFSLLTLIGKPGSVNTWYKLDTTDEMGKNKEKLIVSKISCFNKKSCAIDRYIQWCTCLSKKTYVFISAWLINPPNVLVQHQLRKCNQEAIWLFESLSKAQPTLLFNMPSLITLVFNRAARGWLWPDKTLWLLTLYPNKYKSHLSRHREP